MCMYVCNYSTKERSRIKSQVLLCVTKNRIHFGNLNSSFSLAKVCSVPNGKLTCEVYYVEEEDIDEEEAEEEEEEEEELSSSRALALLLLVLLLVLLFQKRIGGFRCVFGVLPVVPEKY